MSDFKDNWELEKLFIFESNISNNELRNSEYLIPNSSFPVDIDIQKFAEVLNSIFLKYNETIDKGQLIGALNFLNFHYKKTKYKDRFLKFTKYYILSKSWMTKEAKEKYTLNDSFIAEWIEKKEIQLKRPYHLLILFILLGLLIIGIFVLSSYRQLFIGALLGILSTQITWVFGKLRTDSKE